MQYTTTESLGNPRNKRQIPQRSDSEETLAGKSSKTFPFGDRCTFPKDKSGKTHSETFQKAHFWCNILGKLWNPPFYKPFVFGGHEWKGWVPPPPSQWGAKILPKPSLVPNIGLVLPLLDVFQRKKPSKDDLELVTPDVRNKTSDVILWMSSIWELQTQVFNFRHLFFDKLWVSAPPSQDRMVVNEGLCRDSLLNIEYSWWSLLRGHTQKYTSLWQTKHKHWHSSFCLLDIFHQNWLLVLSSLDSQVTVLLRQIDFPQKPLFKTPIYPFVCFFRNILGAFWISFQQHVEVYNADM